MQGNNLKKNPISPVKLCPLIQALATWPVSFEPRDLFLAKSMGAENTHWSALNNVNCT